VGRRQCTICSHQARAHAEILLARGDTIASTARRLGMSQDALERHWKRHCTEEMRAALKPGAKALAARQALAGQLAEEGSNSLDHLRAARALLWQMLVTEREAGHTALATMAATQFVKACGLIAKITGEWADSPLIANTSLHLHFASDPGFLKLMDDLAVALEAYPEARAAVFKRFEALEAEDSPVAMFPRQPITLSESADTGELEEHRADAPG